MTDAAGDAVSDPLDFRKPNYGKKTANLNYQSEATGEFGVIEVRPGTTEEQIMDQYVRKFPKECKLFLTELANANASLNAASGMSKEGTMMVMGKIPEVLMCAMKFIREDYWESNARTRAFFRKFPKLMVGDHRVKSTKGVIIK